MTLTNEDLQAFASLLQPVTDRLDRVDSRLDGMASRFDRVEGRLDKLESEVSALKVGQIELMKELKGVKFKLDDTYELALEAWGKSTENRRWLETSMG